MRWPLRHQIMGPLLAVAIASLAAVGALQARLSTNHARQRIEQQLRGVVGVLAAPNFPLTEPVLRKMRDLSSAEFALTDERGRIVAASFAAGGAVLPGDRATTRFDHVALGASLTIADRDYFHTPIRLVDPEDARAARVLHVLFPRDEYRRTLRQAYLPPLLVGVAAVAAAAVAARLLAGRISRATARLGEEVQRLARGDFSPVALPAADDEIRDLAQAVNRTAEMLAHYEQQVRRTEQMRTVAQVGASLAHEMRNAATGCRMAVDLHVETCQCGHDPESLVVAQRQLKLMESQLQRFLQIGRQPTSLVRRAVDLGRLVDDLLPLVRPAANHGAVKIDWRRDEDDVVIEGDGDAIGQAVLNLVLNAVEAVRQQPSDASSPRRVTLELCRLGESFAELTVSDTGPGPAEATSATMFEPFVTSKAEGAGLGLAVARQTIEAHGGELGWSRRDGITCFRIKLPVTEKEALCV